MEGREGREMSYDSRKERNGKEKIEERRRGEDRHKRIKDVLINLHIVKFII